METHDDTITSSEGNADDDGMDSSSGHERNAPVTAVAAERTADLIEARVKNDDYVEEFLLMMENHDGISVEGGADSSGGEESEVPVTEATERIADVTEAKIKKDGFVEEFQPEVPTMSGSADEPIRTPRQGAVVEGASERTPAVLANNRDGAPGAYPVSTHSNTPVRRTSSFLIGTYGSTIGFVDEAKEEEAAPNFAGVHTSAHDSDNVTAASDLHTVEAQPVPDVDEEGTTMVAEARHLRMKWYQRPFYRWILVGSTLFTCGLLVVVIVLVTRPAAANSSSSMAPPTLEPSQESPPTLVATYLTPEQIACKFLSIPNVTKCRSKVMFDSWNDGNTGDKTTGFTIPSEIGLMTQLTHLDFYNNKLNSTIPSELGLLTNLTLLSIWKNQLTGTIPKEITLLTNLLFLDFLYDQLTGTIPTEMALLTKMIRWDVSNNRLTSTFPSGMGLLTNLTYLSIYSNELSGTIPSEIGLLTNLLYVYTSSNQLTSTIPTEIALMTQLSELDFYNNRLLGTIPSSLCALGYMMIWIDCGEITCGSGCCISGVDGYPSCG